LLILVGPILPTVHDGLPSSLQELHQNEKGPIAALSSHEVRDCAFVLQVSIPARQGNCHGVSHGSSLDQVVGMCEENFSVVSWESLEK
jgi:hypothetical protein